MYIYFIMKISEINHDVAKNVFVSGRQNNLEKKYIRKNSQLTKERLDESSRKYAKAQGCRNNKSSIYLCVIK